MPEVVDAMNCSLIILTYRWPYYQHDPEMYRKHMSDYFYFFVRGVSEPLGYVHRTAIDAMIWPEDIWEIDRNQRFLTLGGAELEASDRTQKLQTTLQQNLAQHRVVSRWYNESLPVYARNGDLVLNVDLSGVGLFGVISHGVHATGFVRFKRDDGSQEYQYWVPRRSYTKSAFPSMLDNFVAGNIIFGESPLEGMIREVHEETGISPDFSRAHLRSCGTVSYQMSSLNDGCTGCQHHCQFVFELELPANMNPTPNDGEVESFTLMSLTEVQEALMQDKFTPYGALTYLAHFVRHGILNCENETRIMEVCSRLHRKHELFVA